MQFFSEILAFFRNYHFINAKFIFRWSLQIFICAWDTRVSLKNFYNTLNPNGAKLFAIMHLGTIMHFQTYTLHFMYFTTPKKNCS